jgi:hypothetical protein
MARERRPVTFPAASETSQTSGAITGLTILTIWAEYDLDASVAEND